MTKMIIYQAWVHCFAACSNSESRHLLPDQSIKLHNSQNFPWCSHQPCLHPGSGSHSAWDPQMMASDRGCRYQYPRNGLTHGGRVTHICVNILDHHWFRSWLVAWSAPSHYLNQCWDIVNWTLRNKLQWHLNERHIFSFKKIHLKMSSGKCRPFCLGLHVLSQLVCKWLAW